LCLHSMVSFTKNVLWKTGSLSDKPTEQPKQTAVKQNGAEQVMHGPCLEDKHFQA